MQWASGGSTAVPMRLCASRLVHAGQEPHPQLASPSCCAHIARVAPLVPQTAQHPARLRPPAAVDLGQNGVTPHYFEQTQAEALDLNLTVLETLIRWVGWGGRLSAGLACLAK